MSLLLGGSLAAGLDQGTAMASKRQIEANRRNARRSTGPKTAAGKAKASRNALCHGLARAGAWDDGGLLSLVEGFISAAEPVPLDDAEVLARARTELSRIRGIRSEMLAAVLQSQNLKILQSLKRLERYERAARAKQKRVLRSKVSLFV